MQNRQLTRWAASASGLGGASAFTQEPFQQRVHGNALPPRFVGKAGFGFVRNFDTHGLLLLSFRIP
jgi:hypothetical protein